MLAIYEISNKLTFDLLTLKLVSESRVTWATSVPILVLSGSCSGDPGNILTVGTDTATLRSAGTAGSAARGA